MTALEKLKIEHPEEVDTEGNRVNPDYCPSWFGYGKAGDCIVDCEKCWNREIPEIPEKIVEALCEAGITNAVSAKELKEAMTIKDSGTRREFETGAVRDIQEGKGRCDLLPLDVLAAFYEPYGYNDCNMDVVLEDISEYVSSGEAKHLFNALEATEIYNSCHESMFLEVAKHFEEGAKKYGEYNWQKGIPTHCYIDSAVRHYLKYLRGDTDEPHDRAFVWNILCCIWTCKHKPELNDYAQNMEVSSE
jgi:hypothetical protein